MHLNSHKRLPADQASVMGRFLRKQTKTIDSNFVIVPKHTDCNQIHHNHSDPFHSLPFPLTHEHHTGFIHAPANIDCDETRVESLDEIWTKVVTEDTFKI